MTKKLTVKQKWITKFEKKIKPYHPRAANRIAIKLTQKAITAKSNMIKRSKKAEVTYSLTIEDIRQLLYNNYKTSCKYDKSRMLDHTNMVLDHIIPISKGGVTTKKNIQVISRFSNNLKSSLSEKQFYLLLSWLDTLKPDMAKNIKTRLANGVF